MVIHLRRAILIFLSLLFFSAFRVAAQTPNGEISFQNFLGNREIPLTLFRTGVEDSNGFMWFGTAFDGGIARYDGYDWVFIFDDPNDEKSISSNHILEMDASSNGKIIASTWDGLNVIDPSTMEVQTFRHDPGNPHSLPHNVTQPLLESSKDYYWVGTLSGLSLINLQTGYCDNFKVAPDREGAYNGNFVVFIVRDRFEPGLIWLCTDSGLYFMEESSSEITHVQSPRTYDNQPDWYFTLHDLVQDENGILWINKGHDHGCIFSYNPQSKKWKEYPYTGPVNKFDQRSGLTFNGLHEGNGDTLYFTSVIGNGYFLRNEGVYNLFSSDGNGENQNNAGWTSHIINDRHGRLWWPGYEGIARSKRVLAEPKIIAELPRVWITRVIIDSTEYLWPPFPKIEFQTKENHLDISFALPNAEYPEDVVYSFKLEPRDKDWEILTGINRVEFQNLPPGKYKFIVRADEGKGWTKQTSMEVAVSIPFKQSPLFPLAIISSTIFMVAFGYFINDRIRTRRETKLQKEYKQEVDKIQMTALRAQMNPHFLFNSLNSIKYYAISKDKDATADYLTKFALLVRTILNNSRSHTISMKDELDALRLYIEIEHLRLEAKFDYTIDVDDSIRLNQAQIPPMILQPFVENAIWHGLMPLNKSGKLLVQVKDMGSRIQCVIEDNGIGREKSKAALSKSRQHKEAMGMNITRDRISLINKIYGVDTQVEVIDLIDRDGLPGGTRVVIFIPFITDN